VRPLSSLTVRKQHIVRPSYCTEVNPPVSLLIAAVYEWRMFTCASARAPRRPAAKMMAARARPATHNRSQTTGRVHGHQRARNAKRPRQTRLDRRVRNSRDPQAAARAGTGRQWGPPEFKASQLSLDE
jgi:hypothetical protein